MINVAEVREMISFILVTVRRISPNTWAPVTSYEFFAKEWCPVTFCVTMAELDNCNRLSATKLKTFHLLPFTENVYQI